MLKQLNKIFLAICFVCFLSFSPVVAQNNDIWLEDSVDEMELIQKDIKVNDLDIEPINTKAVKKTVVPDTRQEGKKVMLYFLKVMFGVMLCAIILYVVLIFVKKYYGSAFVATQEEEQFENLDLSTPENKQEALKSFLNRTK